METIDSFVTINWTDASDRDDLAANVLCGSDGARESCPRRILEASMKDNNKLIVQLSV